METETTRKTHFKVVRYMFESGIKLHLKSVTIATAAVIYHRFFERCSLKNYDPYVIGMTALYLAGKVEEELTKMRDVINVCYRTQNETKPPLEIGTTYWTLRETVANTELLILRVLQFKVSITHPHKCLLHFLKSLQSWLEPAVVERFPIASTAWALLRDSYHGKMCLKHPPEHTAVAVLYMALQCHGIEVPHSRQAEFKWWEAFVEDISLRQIRDIIVDIMEVYNMENVT